MDELQYDFLALVLEEEFNETYLRFFNQGILHFELLNLVEACRDLSFEEDSRLCRYAFIGAIAEYLEGHGV